MGIIEKIQQIEQEISRTQKNKATEYHLGLLKGKLARYRRELLEPAAGASGGKKGQGFEVAKRGLSVVLIGLPSVGKSSFLNKVTKSDSEIAHYAFTTLTSVPGILRYKGAEIQIVDLPGIIKGASDGRGRGRQVVATAKTADMVLMVLDATKGKDQRAVLERELESVGIRLNKERPNIYFKEKKTGGIKVTTISPPKYLSEKVVTGILRDYRLHNADVLIRDENATVDDFIDIINDKHIKYVRCVYAYNKIDSVSLEEVDRIAREPYTIVMSVEQDLGVDDAVDAIWHNLNLIRVYTKRRGVQPNFDDPLVIKADSTLETICNSIHRDLKSNFKYGLVWGTSAKHSPQKCGLTHSVEDEDVVSVVAKV